MLFLYCPIQYGYSKMCFPSAMDSQVGEGSFWPFVAFQWTSQLTTNHHRFVIAKVTVCSRAESKVCCENFQNARASSRQSNLGAVSATP